MQTAQFRTGQVAYRPTSLDFINRPNPVEPHTDPHKHPLHTDQARLRLLHDPNIVGQSIGNGEPHRKRRKSNVAPPPDKGRPTLPAVRQQSEKRLRIPPTLSGLHHPPPDAGILPSISVDGLRSVELTERNAAPPPQQWVESTEPQGTDKGQHSRSIQQAVSDQVLREEAPLGATNAPGAGKGRKPRKNKKWTDKETDDLLKGVEKHGIGSWTKVLKDPEFEFDERRTGLDLKDRFRVCCPDHYKTTAKPKVSEPTPPTGPSQSPPTQAEKPKRNRNTHRKTQAELQDLGIEDGFAKSARRKRTAYSEEEDQAILDGFQKYGHKWLTIQQDEDLGLDSRKPMDLRDRMRTRWPGEYAKAGLKLRTEKTMVDKQQTKGEGKDREANRLRSDASKIIQASAAVTPDKRALSRPEKESKEPESTIGGVKKTNVHFLTQADDVFWGLPLDAEEARVTLDRRILDWPLDFARNISTNNTDSIPTLSLPRPNPLFAVPAAPPHQSAATLPSLATVTAGSLPFDFTEQLELPSLLEGFGALEESSDARAGMQLMPSLEELLG